MKTIIILIVAISLFLFSCNNSSNTKDSTFEEELSYDDTQINESEKETFVEENSEEMTEDEVIKFNVLYDIPSHWTMITETDSVDIIYNPCFEQNPSVSIKLPSYEKNDYILFLGIAQDGIELKITSIENSNPNSITMKTENGEDIVFEWADKNKGIARWEISKMINTNFVNDKYLSDFPAVNEECDDEW